MKLIELIERVDKHEANQDYFDSQTLSCEMDMFEFYMESDRIKVYWLFKWLCTDSHVGGRAYFIDDELFAVSMQTGRKCPEVFEWFSKSMYDKVKLHMDELYAETLDAPTPTYMDLDQDMGDHFEIGYRGCVMETHARHPSFKDKVKIIREKPSEGYDKFHDIIVEDTAGKRVVVDCRELKFDYNLAEI